MRTLYHHQLLPACRKVRIILGEKKLDFAPKLEKEWDLGKEVRQLDSSNRLPVMVDPNNIVLADSYAICEYLEEAYPEPGCLSGNLHQRAEIRRLSGWFDGKFYEEVGHNILFEKFFKRCFKLGQPDTQAIRHGLNKIHEHLRYMAALLDRRNWLAGDSFSLADITAAAHISTIDYLGDVPWEAYPEVKDWYARVKSRPSFRPLLNDVVPGVNPPSHYKNLDF